MGTHIRKVLGYGLTNVTSKNNQINDDRFVDELPKELFDGTYLQSFLSWFERNRDECIKVVSEFNNLPTPDASECFLMISQLKELKTGREPALSHPIVYDAEYGKKNVFVMLPLELSDCYRFDDLIDYYEADCQIKPKVKVLTSKCGIFPYLGMLRKPGRTLPPGLLSPNAPPNHPLIIGRVNPSEYNIMTGRWSKKEPPTLTGELLEHALNDYRPEIPESIILMAYRYQIFKDWKETLSEMKPIVYTFWS